MTADLNNQEKLEEIFHLTVENNEILRSIRRQQHIGNAFRFLYWLVILGVLGGAYYYVKPVVDNFAGGQVKVGETLKQFEAIRSQLPETQIIDQVMKSFKNPVADTPATTQ